MVYQMITWLRKICQGQMASISDCKDIFPSYLTHIPSCSAILTLDNLQLMVYHIYKKRFTFAHDERRVFQDMFRLVFASGKKEDPYVSSCELSLRSYGTDLACRRCLSGCPDRSRRVCNRYFAQPGRQKLQLSAGFPRGKSG